LFPNEKGDVMKIPYLLTIRIAMKMNFYFKDGDEIVKLATVLALLSFVVASSYLHQNSWAFLKAFQI